MSSTATKLTRLAREGDLVFIPVDGALVLAVAVGITDGWVSEAAFGDVHWRRDYELKDIAIIYREQMRPGISNLIGKSFASYKTARESTVQFWNGRRGRDIENLRSHGIEDFAAHGKDKSWLKYSHK